MAEPAPTAATATTAPSSGKPSPTRSAFLTDASRIREAIKVLRDRRSAVTLRFENEQASFQAHVLDIKGTEFLIDDVHPRDGLAFLKAKKTFALAGRADGMYVYAARNVVKRTESERGVPYFHIDLPNSLLFQQRRANARYRLPLSVAAAGAVVHLHRSDGSEPLTGRVLDLSVGGCRVEFDGPVTLGFDEIIPTCNVHISQQLDLHAEAVIRHVAQNTVRNTVTCGIELTEMHVTDRRRLELFIQSITKTSL